MAKPTIVQVARLAGVSNSTVSRCLNQPENVDRKTLARVRKVIEEIGYRPNLLAQNFRRGQSDIVLVVVHNVGTSLFSDILDGIRSVLGSRFSVILMESRSEAQGHARFIDLLVAKQVVGVILLCASPTFDPRLIGGFDDQPRLPVVIGLEPVSADLADLPSVHIDNFRAAHDATTYLLDMGHREIAFVSGARDSLITLDRERGFAQAMAQAGCADPGALILHGDLSIQGGMAAAHRLLTSADRPTALFCANDDIALGAMSVAAQLGIGVPEDLSVMGFDDTIYAATANPPLSTVAQPTREVGERTARQLLHALDHPEDGGQGTEILPHRLIIRKSTAQPRNPSA